MNSHLNKLPLMMKDSLIIIRVRDRHFIRLIIQDRIIRSTHFIRDRLITTRARDRLTTLGTVTAAVMAEDMAEVTVTSRRISKWGQSSSPFFYFKNDNIMTNIGNNCDSVPLLLR